MLAMKRMSVIHVPVIFFRFRELFSFRLRAQLVVFMRPLTRIRRVLQQHGVQRVLSSSFVFVIPLACSVGLLRAQVPAPAPALDDPQTEQRITGLLGEMTLEEKIG